MMTNLPPAPPARVPLATQPLGILGSLKAGQRNVLELIPEIATRQPMLSGRTGKRWHMVMDPGALKVILRDRVDSYPKSLVTKLISGARDRRQPVCRRRGRMALAAPHRRPGVFASQCCRPCPGDDGRR